MALLLWDGLGAVLDLADLAGTGSGVEDHHVEFTDGELQYEDFLLRIGQLGFQQDDYFIKIPVTYRRTGIFML